MQYLGHEQKRKSVKGKPSERLGRKVTGLKGFGPMTAGSPDKAFTNGTAVEVLMCDHSIFPMINPVTLLGGRGCVYCSGLAC